MSKITDAEANATSLDGLINDDGLIPTLRNGPKPSWEYLVNEVRNSRGFRVVGAFENGFTYELFNDVGIDSEGNGWIYVGDGSPNKTVVAGTLPSTPDYEQVTFNSADNIMLSNGRNVDDQSIQSRQSIEAIYKAQGYNNVFFFEDGFTYTEANDVGVYSDGTAWTYADAGTLPVTIAAGTVPSEGVYEKVEVKAENVKFNDGSNVQDLVDDAPNNAGAKIPFTQGSNYTTGSLARATEEVIKSDTYSKSNHKNVLQSHININKQGIYPWGGRGVSILGDSISHMAFSKDAFRNNWTNIFKRCFNAEHEKSSYGFVSILPYLGTGSNQSYEIHDVTKTGSWTALTGVDCEWSMSGYAEESSTVNDTIDVVVPSFQRFFGIWYHSFSGGGTFEVLVNGVSKGTVDSDGADGSTRTSGLHPIGQLDVIDDGTGVCNIQIKVVSGAVRILGLSYENAEYDLQVSNWSQSGRQLRYVSQEVIQKAMSGAMDFVLALGFNDGQSAQNDPTYLAELQQRIDWIIAEANANGTKVWILNFNWQRPITDNIAIELKRCADSITNATYIRFADYIKLDGTTPSSSYLTDVVRLWVDSAHPTVLGHKMIGETVAKTMGLSCSSKNDALLYHDWWIPVKFNSTLRNTFTDPLQVTAYKRNGNSLIFRIYCYSNLVDNATTAVPAGIYDMVDGADLPFNIYVPNTAFLPIDWSLDDDELTKPYYSALLEARFARNGFRLRVKTTTERNIDGYITVPVFSTAERM